MYMGGMIMIRTCRNLAQAVAAVIALLASSPWVLAAGGDIIWSIDPEQDVAVASVDYDSGHVFALRNDFSSWPLTVVVVTAYEAHSGHSTWQERIDFTAVGGGQILAGKDEIVVVGNADPGLGPDWMIASFDRMTGAPRWLTTVTDPVRDGFAGGVTIVDDVVVVVGSEIAFTPWFHSSFVVRGFSLKSGELLWEDEDERKGGSFGDAVVAVSDDDEEYPGIAVAYGVIQNTSGMPWNINDVLVRAHDPATGERLWEHTIDHGADDMGLDNIATSQGRVYFAYMSFACEPDVMCPNWKLSALAAKDGSPLWSSGWYPGFIDGLAARGKNVAATAWHGIHGFNARNGEHLWSSFDFPEAPLFPVAFSNRVMAAGFNFDSGFLTVYAVNSKNGEAKWITEVPEAFPEFDFGMSKFDNGDSVDAGDGLLFVGGTQLTVFKIH
jgi:outer membrane protein assembly factor BamB